MITDKKLLKIVDEIASLYCEYDEICRGTLTERIRNNFNNIQFAIFISNSLKGRFYFLKYSNWRVGNSCRKMLIDVKLTDAITNEIKTGYWFYDNVNCTDLQYNYLDLNTLINRYGYVLYDEPIRSKNNSDITKQRLIYNSTAKPYGFTYIPVTPGGGSGVTLTPPTQTPPEQIPNVPNSNSFDIKNLLENPIVLIGIGLAAYLLLIKK